MESVTEDYEEGNRVAERTWGKGRMDGFHLGILGTLSSRTGDCGGSGMREVR